MSRFDTLEEKINKLIDRSFVGTRQSVENGVQVNQDTLQRQIDELVALIQYFQDRKLYVLDLPITLIPNPHGARRLVDPNLRGVPSNKTVHVMSRNFRNSYELVEEINNLLDQEKEVFLYSLDFLTVYDPQNFDPNYRILVRYVDIDLSYWDTPISTYDNGENIYIPTQNININLTNEQLSKDEGTIKIINNVLRHKF
jgi:hypothetical protein